MLVKELVNLNESSRRAMLAAMVCLMAVAIYRWTISPQLTYLRAVQDYGPVVERMHKQAVSLQAGLQTRRRILEELQQQLQDLQPRFYGLDEAGRIVHQFMAMAGAAGCTVTGIQVRQHQTRPGANPQGPASRLDLEVTVTGSYDGIIGFLKAIQQQHRLIYVTAMNLGPSDQTGQVLQCSLSTAVYLIQQEEI
ncbi:MAG: type 4a pilus biogenesis protein PilO [Sedimentisphaerales bacterium]|nr:type 4a pilus biogenesis protein PilO [Sedimentisphaerales bacterium]